MPTAAAFLSYGPAHMSTTVTMPQLGESVVEGTIGKWLVSEGDQVTKDQPIVEILTDKADSELPSPVSGLVTKLFAAEDDIVPVGDPVCEIDEGASAKAGVAPASADESTAAAEPAQAPTSPSVRKLARDRDVDLSKVSGTGEAGRILQEDVRAAAEAEPATGRTASPPPPPAAAPAAPVAPAAAPAVPASARGDAPAPRSAFRLPPYVPKAGDELVPFSRRRRIIADHMVYSKHTAPDIRRLLRTEK